MLASDTLSHNLYLRALVADDRPAEALAHFEAMAAGRWGEGAGVEGGAGSLTSAIRAS